MKAIVTQKRHEDGWLSSDSGCGHGLGPDTFWKQNHDFLADGIEKTGGQHDYHGFRNRDPRRERSFGVRDKLTYLEIPSR